MQKTFIVKAVLILLFIVLLIVILFFTGTILIPLSIAGILSLLFIPMCSWLERKGLPRVAASVICALCFVLFLYGIFMLLEKQVSNIADDFNQIKQNVTLTFKKVQDYIHTNFNISKDKQNNMLSSSEPGSGGIGKTISAVTGSLLNVAVNLIIIMVYTIMLLMYRTHFKNFILKMVPESQQGHTKKIIADVAQVAQHYMKGLFMVISFLWLMYGIGFSILGVKNAIFYAILCGILEIIPFVGNLTGCSLTCIMVLSQGGGTSMVLGVIVTYAIAQSIQFYIVAPLIMNSHVKINPLFSILALFCGDLLWGIPGMIIAIPVLGMIKIIFDNVEETKPLGYLIGGEPKKTNKPNALMHMIKKRLHKS